MINGAGPRQKNMSRQIDPNLALLLQSAGKGGGRYDLSGNPIMPGQAPPSGLGAFYEMQNQRAQQLGGVSQSRMLARDMMAQEEAARQNGGRIPQVPVPTAGAGVLMDPNGYGGTPAPVMSRTAAAPAPAGPSVLDQMGHEARQRQIQRGGYDNPMFGPNRTSAGLDPNSIAGRYFAGGSDREMAGLYNQLEPGRQPDPAAYARQAGINERSAQDSLLGQMGIRGSRPRTSRMVAAPRVDRSQSLARRMFDAGLL